jgi:Zn-dependent M28 family amino/carboxypeptidase
MGPRTPRLSTSNVIGLLPGRDPEACGQFIVVGAHHDHLGRGGYASLASAGEAHRVHPGADDNASGLAGLLELARRLRAGPALRRSVLLVGFGAEEFGQLGSREFLDCGPIAPPAIVAMVNLDQIGRAESRTPRVYGVGSGIGLEALVEAAARGRGVKAQLHAWSSPRSDHYRFLRQEIPALLFHTGLHDQYHRPSDVPGLVEIKGALRVVDLAERVIRDLAEADVAPAFQRPKEDR